MIGILLLICVATLIFMSLRSFNYWAKKHVETGTIIPLVGDILPNLLGKESFAEITNSWYKKVRNVRYTGIYQYHNPMLLIKSPELIKRICVKDCNHFIDHSSFITEAMDPFLSRSVDLLNGKTWKDMRAILSPSFTSSKMRMMFLLICDKAELFVQHLLEKEEEIVEVELREACERFCNDIFANICLGIHVDSQRNEDDIFYNMMRKFTDFNSLYKKIILFLYQLNPKMSALLGLKILDRDSLDFFINMVKDSIELRKKNDTKKSDILGVLMEAKKVQEKYNIEDSQIDLSPIGIAAQVFNFFMSGFELVPINMCFMAYELAINPDIQKKLIQEIDENRPETGRASYEIITKMEYLDMVVSETLRLWPIAVALDRLVTKQYTIQPEFPDEQPVHLDVNDVIMIPIFAIHRDPQYYPEPEKFDPDRFSPENKKKIVPYTYFPFGIGPRDCIGARFTILHFKVLFFHLLSYFEIVPVEKTNIPVKIDKAAIIPTSINGFPLGFKRRYRDNQNR